MKICELLKTDPRLRSMVEETIGEAGDNASVEKNGTSKSNGQEVTTRGAIEPQGDATHDGVGRQDGTGEVAAATETEASNEGKSPPNTPTIGGREPENSTSDDKPGGSSAEEAPPETTPEKVAGRTNNPQVGKSENAGESTGESPHTPTEETNLQQRLEDLAGRLADLDEKTAAVPALAEAIKRLGGELEELKVQARSGDPDLIRRLEALEAEADELRKDWRRQVEVSPARQHQRVAYEGGLPWWAPFALAGGILAVGLLAARHPAPPPQEATKPGAPDLATPVSSLPPGTAPEPPAGVSNHSPLWMRLPQLRRLIETGQLRPEEILGAG